MPLGDEPNIRPEDPDVWQPPPIKRTTLATVVAVVVTLLAGLTGGSSYLGNATADVQTQTRLETIERELQELKLDIRDLQRDLRDRRERAAPK